MRDPNTYRCGCPKVAGERQCVPCHNAQTTARRKGEPIKHVSLVDTHFNCGHPRIPSNTLSGGKGYRKGRCKFCRNGVLTFDLATGEPKPFEPQPRRDPTRWRTCDHPRTPANTARSGSGSETCKTCKSERNKQYRIGAPKKLRQHRVGSRTPEPPKSDDTLSLARPIVQPIQEAQCGRSYGLFPLKRRTA